MPGRWRCWCEDRCDEVGRGAAVDVRPHGCQCLGCLGVASQYLRPEVGLAGNYTPNRAHEPGNTNSALILAEQDKRIALEQWLAASDQAHYRALTDEQTKQARLRDRLATADLRLSVLLDATDSVGRDGVQATTGAGGVVYGTARAQLDPAHAQRIIGITGDGDQGLIALQACQAYARAVAR